jgi:hypothetical protein
METRRQSTVAGVRHAVRSLGPFDYAATLVLLAVFVVGTSMDKGPL